MTILLGIASAQEQNIKETRMDVGDIKERLNAVDQRLDRMESMLTQIIERLSK